MSPNIRIWRYSESPEEFKALSIINGISALGGKEEWLTHVPVQLVGFLPWIESKHGDMVAHYPLKDGSVVYIRARI